jgi:hypothetical protein
VGERGVTLSGGQRARINLARWGVCAIGWNFQLLSHSDRTVVRERDSPWVVGRRWQVLRDKLFENVRVGLFFHTSCKCIKPECIHVFYKLGMKMTEKDYYLYWISSPRIFSDERFCDCVYPVPWGLCGMMLSLLLECQVPACLTTAFLCFKLRVWN